MGAVRPFEFGVLPHPEMAPWLAPDVLKIYVVDDGTMSSGRSSVAEADGSWSSLYWSVITEYQYAIRGDRPREGESAWESSCRFNRASPVRGIWTDKQVPGQCTDTAYSGRYRIQNYIEQARKAKVCADSFEGPLGSWRESVRFGQQWLRYHQW